MTPSNKIGEQMKKKMTVVWKRLQSLWNASSTGQSHYVKIMKTWESAEPSQEWQGKTTKITPRTLKRLIQNFEK